MAVYTISFVIIRKRDDGNSEVMPYMQVVSTNGPDSFDVAIEHIKTNFSETKYAAKGFEIQGDPVLFEIHEGLYADWENSMSPAPATEHPKPQLTVVK